MTSLMRLIVRFATPRCTWGRVLAIDFFARMAIVCIILSSNAPALVAQTSVVGKMLTEEQVKAASLYRFLGYVEWPRTAFPRADSPYVISVINADEIADELLRLTAGRSLDNRPVTVRRLRADQPVTETHVLFIGRGEHSQLRQLLRQVQGQPILVVTEWEGALSQGSMINFRLVEDRVRFEIALEPVGKAGLQINSRMLSVALSVVKESQ
jgi:hypothetical protein